MKIIGSVKEDLSAEKRVSITPESVKKFKGLPFRSANILRGKRVESKRAGTTPIFMTFLTFDTF